MKLFTNDDSQKMCDMQEKVFGIYFISIESGLFSAASRCSPEYHGGSWALVTDDEETTGFMYPTGQATFPTCVATNGYENAAMPAVAFGAALSIMVTNHMSWIYHERGQPQAAQKMATIYEKMRDFMFNLSEADPTYMDATSVVGFID